MTQRVDDLLEALTIEEKAWQLVGTYVGVGATESGGLIDLESATTLVAEKMIGTVAAFGIGNSLHTTPREVAEVANDLQRTALEESRLGIPLLMPVDGVHGHGYIAGATVFPHNLGLAATFDADLAERVARVTAREIRATGATQNYSPGTDVARDPRWGRTYETFGESPHLVASLAAAKVRGYQASDLAADDAVVATPKHFPAYSEPRRGEDASPVDISDYTLRRVFLPPFEAALEAGARSVMPCYNSVGGEPVHGSERYLTGLLRDELDFEGYVVSDWSGVRMLESHHGTAADMRDAVRQTTTAGLDVASIGQAEHAQELIGLVEDGTIPESRLDESVRRLLGIKEELGLFDDPYVDPDTCVETLGQPGHRSVAYEAASRGLTLLENDGILPLEDAESIFVTGHAADDMRVQCGGWSAIQERNIPGTTVREGLEAIEDVEITHEPVSVLNGYRGGAIDRAVDAAAAADVAVAVLGETWYLHEFGPSFVTPGTGTGRFPTRSSLDLPESQQRLLERLTALETPTILILIAGRPLTLPDDAGDAVMMAYYPGTAGGRAIADVLTGETNPAGRLPISWPQSLGQLPVRFNYLEHPHPIGDDEHPDSYDPRYPFGHGLSYTDFDYRSLRVGPEVVEPAESVTVRVTVENVGDRPGEETVLVYGHDVVSSRVTPVRSLVGVERVTLEPGESNEVSILIDVAEFGVVRGDDRVVEPGTIELFVEELSTSFEIAAH